MIQENCSLVNKITSPKNCGIEKNHLFLPGIEPRLLNCPGVFSKNHARDEHIDICLNTYFLIEMYNFLCILPSCLYELQHLLELNLFEECVCVCLRNQVCLCVSRNHFICIQVMGKRRKEYLYKFDFCQYVLGASTESDQTFYHEFSRLKSWTVIF
jgi:hypothetical protein